MKQFCLKKTLKKILTIEVKLSIHTQDCINGHSINIESKNIETIDERNDSVNKVKTFLNKAAIIIYASNSEKNAANNSAINPKMKNEIKKKLGNLANKNNPVDI